MTMHLRLARHTARLDALVAFYRDGLGLDGLRVVLVPERWTA
jgi:hypothetical protein